MADCAKSYVKSQMIFDVIIIFSLVGLIYVYRIDVIQDLLGLDLKNKQIGFSDFSNSQLRSNLKIMGSILYLAIFKIK